MSNFDQRALENLKRLCRIDCSSDEDEEILRSVGRILEYVHLLEDADTTSVPSCNFVLKGMLKTVMREDEPQDLLSREQFLSNAPDQISGMIRVPPVMNLSLKARVFDGGG